MCRRHGASWVSDPDARLELRCCDEARISVYQFGQRTSHWIVCARRGVLAAVISKIDGRLRAVVRSQAMVDHRFSAPEVATYFEEESVESRLARRARTWIGSVMVSPPLQIDFGP